MPIEREQLLKPHGLYVVVHKDGIDGSVMAVNAETVHRVSVGALLPAIVVRGGIGTLWPSTPEIAVQENGDVTAAFDVRCSPESVGRYTIN